MIMRSTAMRSEACKSPTSSAIRLPTIRRESQNHIADRRLMTVSELWSLVIICVKMVGDFRARRLPNPMVRTDVIKRHVEVFNTKREADNKRVKRYRHYPSLGCTLRVQGVELIADHLIPVLRGVAALKDHADII